MAFTFRVRFQGLCAFVAKSPIGAKPNEGWILLPKIEKPVDQDPKDLIKDHDTLSPPHWPVLRALRDHWIGGQPTLEFAAIGDVSRRIRVLKDMEVEFRPDGRWIDQSQGQQPELAPQVVSIAQGPHPGNEFSVLWMLAVEEMLKTWSKDQIQPIQPWVRPSFLGKSLELGDFKLVSCRVQLDRGILTAPVREPNGDFETVEIHLNGKKVTDKYVATEIVLEIPGVEKYVEIWTLPLEGSDDPIRLEPKAGQNEVEIEIINREPEAIFNVPALFPQPDGKPIFDFDVNSYLSLFEPKSAQEPQGIPAGTVLNLVIPPDDNSPTTGGGACKPGNCC